MLRTIRALVIGMLLAGLLAVSTAPALAQEVVWVRQFSAPVFAVGATGVAVDGTGSIYVVGSDVLLKYDPSGRDLWTRQLGTSLTGPGAAGGYAVAVNTTGNVYVAGEVHGTFPGQTQTSVADDAFVSKYASDGTELWTRQFGTSSEAVTQALSIATDANGDVYVGGWAYTLGTRTTAGSFRSFVRKYESNGRLAWSRWFANSGIISVDGVAVDNAGSVYVAGEVTGALPGQTATSGINAFVRRYDQNGNEQWTREFGGPEGAEASGLAVDPAGDIVVVGGTSGTLLGQTTSGSGNNFLRKYDPQGTVIWTHEFGGPENSAARGVAVDRVGNIYLAGETFGALPGQVAVGEGDAFVQRYDSNGTPLWTRQFGSSSIDFANALAVDATGNVYVAGSTEGTLPGATKMAGFHNGFVAKLSQSSLSPTPTPSKTSANIASHSPQDKASMGQTREGSVSTILPRAGGLPIKAAAGTGATLIVIGTIAQLVGDERPRRDT